MIMSLIDSANIMPLRGPFPKSALDIVWNGDIGNIQN